LARRVVRGALEATRALKLTAEETEANVELAKDAVAKALSKLKDEKADVAGMTAMPSGKWRVAMRYQGEPRNFGTYNTRERAMLANHIARGEVEATRGQKLTSGEAEANVKLAKDAVARFFSKLKDSAERRAPLDTDMIGVTTTVSGKWAVAIKYQGENQSIGTHDTRERAMLANHVARGKLEATSGRKLTFEEAEANVELAKDAVASFFYKLKTGIR